MSDYLLDVTAFEKGVNIYTGTAQGGHAYGTIRTPSRERIELEVAVDAARVREFMRLDPDCVYRVGDATSRLRNRDEVREVAVAWMRANAPGERLVDRTFWLTDGASGEIIFGG